ncbi:MAG: 50S ribosomal protein L18 [bacterium]
MKEDTRNKRAHYLRRKNRTRAKISGTAERPRLSVFRSLKHISAQLINDQADKTLVSASDLEIKDVKGSKSDRAVALGKLIAEKAKAQKITNVVFDRGGRLYHGRVKALADAARQAGLKF